MNPIKLLILILSSVWFIPVSCNSALYMGTHIIAHLDARDTSRVDVVHPVFSVVIDHPRNNPPFQLINLNDDPSLKAKNQEYSLLMSHPSGNILINEYSSASYHVIKNAGNNQVIEVIYKDYGKTVWSKYLATRTNVTPLTSRMFYVGYMAAAFPYALIIGLLLYYTGRFWQKKLKFKTDFKELILNLSASYDMALHSV